MNADANILRNDGSAAAAFLGGSAGLNTNKRATSTFSLVCKSVRKFPPCGIQDALAKTAANHVRDLQVFDGDELMLADDLLAGVVSEIGTKIGNTLIDSLEAIDCLATIAATLDLAAHGTLRVGEFPLCFSRESRVLDNVAVAHGGKRFQTNIDADARRYRNRVWQRFSVIDYQLREPLASPAHDAKLLDRAFGVLDVAGLDRAGNARYADTIATQALTWSLNRKAIPPLPCLESRKSRLAVAFTYAAEKMFERQVNAAKGVTLNLRWNSREHWTY